MRDYYTIVNFEFDESKSARNKAKHGLDFFEAQKLWLDPDCLELAARTEYGEERKLLIARYRGDTWAAIFTGRKDALRIISVRPARTNEEAKYEQARTEDDTRESGSPI